MKRSKYEIRQHLIRYTSNSLLKCKGVENIRSRDTRGRGRSIQGLRGLFEVLVVYLLSYIEPGFEAQKLLTHPGFWAGSCGEQAVGEPEAR